MVWEEWEVLYKIEGENKKDKQKNIFEKGDY
ncbi:MAG: hypothetical protein MPEBLZ_00564 [Candidatus Methanoperedens nitroreducens]|uniref:Uncharacterized protein n=1 Tax=Candidatus Methanoperedens nitratireducens TaxID=1392998 RepID=A0A0P8AJH0_9EURY|nr:MAG: hypothetical protein MPEBLZ_00564 [Candidatus Methanoperedens sp. BLZ1]